MEGTEKKKSMRILPKVEASHYVPGLESLIKNYDGVLQHLKNDNPEILRRMQMHIDAAKGNDTHPIKVTVLSMYGMLRQAAKNNRLPMVDPETLLKIVEKEYPRTAHELTGYLNDNYNRIKEENHLVAYLMADIINQHKNTPNSKVFVLLAGVALYRVLEEQTLNTH